MSTPYEMMERIERLEAALVKVVAERDAMRADAARYRWLRDAAGTVDWTVIHPSSSWSRITTNYCRTTAGGMDAAIDAAIAAKEPANGQG